MDFWDKLRDSANKFSKSSAESAREGVEKLSEKATLYSRISKLKIEIKAAEYKVNEAMGELGGEFYNLYTNNKLTDPATELKTHQEKVQNLKQDLAKKEEALREIYKKYAIETIDKDKVKSMKQALEGGGGTIEQIEIDSGSTIIRKKLKNVKLPKEVLFGIVHRDNDIIIPDGDFAFRKGDRITLLGKIEDVLQAIEMINPPKEK